MKQEIDIECGTQIKKAKNVQSIGKEKEDVKKNYDEVQEKLRRGTHIINKPDTFIKLMNDMLDELEIDKELKDNSLNRERDTAKIIEEFITCSKKQIKKLMN